jgi:hypothetical protein
MKKQGSGRTEMKEPFKREEGKEEIMTTGRKIKRDLKETREKTKEIKIGKD